MNHALINVMDRILGFAWGLSAGMHIAKGDYAGACFAGAMCALAGAFYYFKQRNSI